MVLRNHTQEFLQQLVRLHREQLVDIFWERPNCENAFPARHWVCSHYWMNRPQRPPHVLRAASHIFIDPHLGILIRRLEEPLADESCRQTLEKLLIRVREAIIDLVARCLERIATVQR